MVYDGAVSAIKHGAVFSSVGVVLVNIIITILAPFIGYTILKTASVAAKKVILNTVTICKKTTTTLVGLQVKACKSILATVSKLTKASLKLTTLLIKQIIQTMRRIAGFGKFYCRKCLDTVLAFKDFTLAFVRKGLTIIKKSTSIAVSTVKKLAEIVLDLLRRTPEQLYKFMEAVYTKFLPGMVKIMVYFPVEYYKFMTKWLPAEINFIYNMCTKVVELSIGATSIIVLFNLLGAGIKFVGSFFKIGKQFVSEFVNGVTGILDIIPSFGEILNSDTVMAIPDKIINFLIYEKKFKSGLNEILGASATSLPAIEAKEAEVAAVGSELESYTSQISALQKQIELSPDEEKEFELSRLRRVADGLEIQLNVLKSELDVLIFNRVFTFDELALRSYFSVISFGNVYMEPPPIPKLVILLINGIFNRELTPQIVIPLSVSGSFDLEVVSIEFNVGITVTINPFKLGMLYPQAQAASKLAEWLQDRLLREEAYEIVDGKKLSRIRKASRNPACFAKLYIRVLYYWIKILLTELSFDILSLVSYSFNESVSVEALGGLIDVDTDDFGIGDVLDYLNVGSLTELATREFFNYIGNAVNFLSDNLVDNLVNVVFAGLSTGCSENYEFLS